MKVLMIPSATLVSREMQQKLGKIPSVLYPLNGIPMIEHIYEKYKEEVDKTFVIVHKKKELIKDYILLKKLPIEIIELDEIKDLGYTIYFALKQVLRKYSNVNYVFINYADTLISNNILKYENSLIIYGRENFSEDWTYFENQGSKLIEIVDKSEINGNSDAIKPERKMFVGVFGISFPTEFCDYLQNALWVEEKPRTCDSLYLALLQFAADNIIVYEEATEWFDSGHSKKYMEAKTGVEARSFNSIVIDEKRGILKKNSDNKEKFIDEIMWYVKMPKKLQYLLPRIYDYSTDWEKPYVNMEYYGYNTLHELLIYGNIPLYKWQNIFEKLKFVIQDMGNFLVLNYEEEKKQALEDIYITKTIKRLNKLRTQTEFQEFFEKDIYINTKKYYSLNYYIEALPELLTKRLIENKEVKFSVIHGDLCFSNILIENMYGFMRIIDPRGSFGIFDIYGDTRYELAKLLHSIEGQYDFIIEDMFQIEIHHTKIDFKIGEKTEKIKEIFLDTFKEIMPDYKDIQLIESMLFLSMIPLHEDSKSRQYAMLATGLQLLEKAMD